MLAVAGSDLGGGREKVVRGGGGVGCHGQVKKRQQANTAQESL